MCGLRLGTGELCPLSVCVQVSYVPRQAGNTGVVCLLSLTSVWYMWPVTPSQPPVISANSSLQTLPLPPLTLEQQLPLSGSGFFGFVAYFFYLVIQFSVFYLGL